MANIVDGQSFGPYTIVSKLGRGGMASVFRAYEAKLDRAVALKVLPDDLLEQTGFLERFEREAKIIAHLEHPHIVPVYATGIDEGQPWMALRLVRGGNLAERMERGGGLERESGLRYLGNIAEALDFAHARGIVHRDLKPQNILLGERDECYIADFGIASLLSGAPRLTQTGTALGTPQYMAPEQAKSEAVGPAADIYALGIIAYHWLAGELPFDADTPYAVMYKHVSAPLPLEPLRALPERAQEVMARVLAKDPADRWASAGEFVQQLVAALDEPARDQLAKSQQPSTKAPPSSVPRQDQPNAHSGTKSNHTRDVKADPRRTIASRLAALAVVLMVFAGVWAAYQWQQKTGVSEVAVAGDEEQALGLEEKATDAGLTRQIQQGLNEVGYSVGESGEVDSKTREAIKRFEQQQQMAVTREPGEALSKALKEEIARLDENAWSEAVAADTEASYTEYRQKQPKGRHIAEVDRRITAVRSPGISGATISSESSVAEQSGKLGGFRDLGNGRLLDTETSLIWAQSDNGRDIDWNGANAFCEDRGQRLPTIDELVAIYDRPGTGTTICRSRICKASPLFQLSNFAFWSGSKEDSYRAWYLHLYDGYRQPTNFGNALDTRALCVALPGALGE